MILSALNVGSVVNKRGGLFLAEGEDTILK